MRILPVKWAKIERIILFCLLLSQTTPTWSQKYRYETGFALSRHNFCDTIPLLLDNGRLFLTVTIDGKKQKVLLDTGSSQGVVFANRLPEGLTHLGTVLARDGNGHTDSVQVVQLPRFQLGSNIIEGYVATVHKPTVASKNDHFIVGFDLFNSGLSAKIDLQNRRLILTDRPEMFANESGQRLKYKLKWFVPYVIVSPFKRHADETAFDTGYAGLYTMNKDHFDRHAYKSKNVGSQVEAVVQGQSTFSLFGVEQYAEVAFMHLDRLQLADFNLLNVKVRTTYGSSKLGCELLNYGTVIILPKRRHIVFQPYNGAESMEANNRLKQMAFVPSNNRPMIGIINPMSEPYKLGFRQGDVVLAIDGKPINSFQTFVDYPFVDGQIYTFSLLTADGQHKQIRSVR